MLDANLADFRLNPSSPSAAGEITLPSGAREIEVGYFRALLQIKVNRPCGNILDMQSIMELEKLMDPQGPAAELSGTNLKTRGALEESFRKYVEQSVPLDSPDRPISINFRSHRALATAGGVDSVCALASIENAKGEPCICIEGRLIRYPVGRPIAMLISSDDANGSFLFAVLYSRDSFQVDVGRVALALGKALPSDAEMGYLHREIRSAVADAINRGSEEQPVAFQEIKLLTVDSDGLDRPACGGFRHLVVQTNKGRFAVSIRFSDVESSMSSYALRI